MHAHHVGRGSADSDAVGLGLEVLASSPMGGHCWPQDHTWSVGRIPGLGLRLSSHDKLATVMGASWGRVTGRDAGFCASSSLAKRTATFAVRTGALGSSHYRAHFPIEMKSPFPALSPASCGPRGPLGTFSPGQVKRITHSSSQ